MTITINKKDIIKRKDSKCIERYKTVHDMFQDVRKSIRRKQMRIFKNPTIIFSNEIKIFCSSSKLTFKKESS